MRKHPIRHRVSSYKKNGKTVHSYIRGQGTKQRKMANPIPSLRKEGSSRKTFEDYKVVFYYKNKTKETVQVASYDADDALNLALKRRKKKGLKPIKIEVIDGIGSILGTIVGKVAGSTHDAVNAFRTEYSKGATQRAELASVREENEAHQKAWIERNAKKMVERARKGERTAQIWCEQHHIAWEQI